MLCSNQYNNFFVFSLSFLVKRMKYVFEQVMITEGNMKRQCEAQTISRTMKVHIHMIQYIRDQCVSNVVL